MKRSQSQKPAGDHVTSSPLLAAMSGRSGNTPEQDQAGPQPDRAQAPGHAQAFIQVTASMHQLSGIIQCWNNTFTAFYLLQYFVIVIYI